MLELERELADDYYHSLIGRRLDVLVEGADPQRPGYVRGTACRYVPVAFVGDVQALIRRRVQVWAVEVRDGVMVGHPVTSA